MCMQLYICSSLKLASGGLYESVESRFEPGMTCRHHASVERWCCCLAGSCSWFMFALYPLLWNSNLASSLHPLIWVGLVDIVFILISHEIKIQWKELVFHYLPCPFCLLICYKKLVSYCKTYEPLYSSKVFKEFPAVTAPNGYHSLIGVMADKNHVHFSRPEISYNLELGIWADRCIDNGPSGLVIN